MVGQYHRGQPVPHFTSYPVVGGGLRFCPSWRPRPFGFLQAAGQGNVVPTLALEEGSRGEPHLVRIAEDQPLAALLAFEYHPSRRTPHTHPLLLAPLAASLCSVYSTPYNKLAHRRRHMTSI